MKNEIKIIQPKLLRSVDDLVPSKDFDNLIDCSLTSLRTTPVIMPDVNKDALKNANIRVENTNILSLSQQEQSQLATVYKNVFAGEPWNEVSKCSKTNKFFAFEPGGACTCCNTPTQEAYPLKETMNYIAEELARPDATLILVKDNDQIVGAAWGYSYTNPKEFAQDKYPSEMQNQIISACNKVGITDKFFYMSESFILPTVDEENNLLYRGLGILNAFYQSFVDTAQKRGLPMIGRTTEDSIQVNKALQNFGFELFFGPNVADRRQIRTMENVYVTGIDKQNPKRVLYALGGIK